jgi:hypothetical protein
MQFIDLKHIGCLMLVALMTYVVEYTCRKLLFIFRLVLLFASFAAMTSQRPETQQIKQWLNTISLEDISKLTIWRDAPKAIKLGLQAMAELLHRRSTDATSI